MEGENMKEGPPRSIREKAGSALKTAADRVGNRLGIKPLVPVTEGHGLVQSPTEREKGGNRLGFLGLGRKPGESHPETSPSDSTATSPEKTGTNPPLTDQDREELNKQVQEALEERQLPKTSTDKSVEGAMLFNSRDTATMTRFERFVLKATHPSGTAVVGAVGITGAAGAIGGLVWGINEYVENRAAVHEAVGSKAAEWWNSLNKKSVEGSVRKTEPFDNTARVQEITEENRNTLTELPEEGLRSSYDPEKEIFTQAFPFAVPEGTRIKILNEENPNTGPTVPSQNKRISFENENGNPVSGVGVVVTENGWRYLIREGNEELGYDPSRAGSISLTRYFPEYDKTVVVQLMDPSVSLKANFDSMSRKQVRALSVDDYFSTLPLAPVGQELVETTDDTVQPLISFVYVYQGKTIGTPYATLEKGADWFFLQDATGGITVVQKS
jgi:hypothetical protein